MRKDTKKRKRINWENVLTIKNTVIPFLISWLFLVAVGFSGFYDTYLIILYCIAYLGITLSSIAFFLATGRVRKNRAAEAQRLAAAEEEERLAPIKATMTPAEWETYKLQMDNNRLLKNIQKRGNSTQTTTTTTFGFTE